MKIQQWIAAAVIALFSFTASDVLAGPDHDDHKDNKNSSDMPKLSLQMDSCNCAHLNCSGTPGRKCIVEATTCLCPPTWVAISTNTISGNGSCTLSDPNAGKYPRRFYRLIVCSSTITGDSGKHRDGDDDNGDNDDQGDDNQGGNDDSGD